MAFTSKGPRSRRDKEQKKAEQERLEAGLEEGLEGRMTNSKPEGFPYGAFVADAPISKPRNGR
jgi:hypothetical protein